MGCNKKKKAFTLTELLVVVIVLGVLAGVATPKFKRVLETRKTTEAENMLAAVRTEQEKRCIMGKNYRGVGEESKLDALANASTSNNYTYSLTSSGVSAASKGTANAYTIKMLSYKNGTLCCEDVENSGGCAALNKNYVSCDSVTIPEDECLADSGSSVVEPESGCVEGEIKVIGEEIREDLSCKLTYQKRKKCTDNQWGPEYEEIVNADCPCSTTLSYGAFTCTNYVSQIGTGQGGYCSNYCFKTYSSEYCTMYPVDNEYNRQKIADYYFSIGTDPKYPDESQYQYFYEIGSLMYFTNTSSVIEGKCGANKEELCPDGKVYSVEKDTCVCPSSPTVSSEEGLCCGMEGRTGKLYYSLSSDLCNVKTMCKVYAWSGTGGRETVACPDSSSASYIADLSSICTPGAVGYHHPDWLQEEGCLQYTCYEYTNSVEFPHQGQACKNATAAEIEAAKGY